MAGYANRVKTIKFPDLTEPGEQELFIVIRNPRTMADSELIPDDLPRDADGKPLDMELAEKRGREVIAKLIVAWRMYDATDFAVDPATGEPLDQQPLPLPATPDLVRKLPIEAQRKLNEEITAAVNPQ